MTVKMKGTTIGTASDMHGKFELVIPEAQKSCACIYIHRYETDREGSKSRSAN